MATIEEKAKAYDIALKKIEMLLGSGDSCSREELEYVFPELREDGYEKIRKEIITFIVTTPKERNNHKKWIAWLEAQGEHDNFRNKIQIGDKVTRNEDGVLVNLSQLKRIAKPAENKGKHNMGISEATKQELEDNLNKALEKETPESCNEFLDKQGEQYYSCESDIDFKIEADKWYVCIKDYYYSDIDELMFTKGKAYKAYIDWGFISNNGTKKTPIGLFPYKEYFRPATDEEIPHEQKPAECRQETKPNGGIVCEDFNDGDGYYKVNLAYLSKSQVELIENLVASWQNPTNNTAERSEDDEKILSDIIKDLVHPWNEYIPDRIEDEIKWLKNRLKSLKYRYTWRPSDEQMKALNEAIYHVDDSVATQIAMLIGELSKF